MNNLERWTISKELPAYEISDFGRIRRILGGSQGATAGRILKSTKVATGYHRIRLYFGERKYLDKYVHRLVWETFCGKIPEELEINHKDGDKSNNKLSNLENGNRFCKYETCVPLRAKCNERQKGREKHFR